MLLLLSRQAVSCTWHGPRLWAWPGRAGLAPAGSPADLQPAGSHSGPPRGTRTSPAGKHRLVFVSLLASLVWFKPHPHTVNLRKNWKTALNKFSCQYFFRELKNSTVSILNHKPVLLIWIWIQKDANIWPDPDPETLSLVPQHYSNIVFNWILHKFF